MKILGVQFLLAVVLTISLLSTDATGLNTRDINNVCARPCLGVAAKKLLTFTFSRYGLMFGTHLRQF